MTTERSALYRLYDAGDQLLYVGITDDPKTRFAQHRDDKPWWPQVAIRDVEWFPDRATAEAQERQAIQAESPRYNRQGVRWFHAEMGNCPAEAMSMGDFRRSVAPTIDRVAAGDESVVLTRRGVPLVVLMPARMIETSDDIETG